MKRFLVPALALAVALTAGCDAIRTFSGRPTAAQLEEKKQRILDSLAVVKADEETLAETRAVEADTLHYFASFREMQVAMNGRKQFLSKPLPHQYYIITGAYLDPDNADRNLKRYTDAGYEAVLLTFRSGFQAVAVAPSDNIADIHASYLELRRNDFCPATAWILTNE